MINIHHLNVVDVVRQPSGALAVTVGEHPAQVVLVFEGDEFNEFVSPVRKFLNNEIWDRVAATQAAAVSQLSRR